MSDDRDLTPEQERDVRRMLADARHTEPMPDDVTARLDRVLAELAEGGSGSTDTGPPATIADLASRRRRRATSLLVAAAAVVAIGIGIDQVLPDGSANDSASSADSATSSQLAGPAKSEPSPLNEPGSGDLLVPGTTPESPLRYALRRPAQVSDSDFSTDVLLLRPRALRGNQRARHSAKADSRHSQSLSAPANGALDGFDCPAADWGAGVFVPVLYDGDPGVLVFRRAMSDSQVVDLFQCGSSSVLRSITLPSP